MVFHVVALASMADWISSEVESNDKIAESSPVAAGSGIAGTAAAEAGVTSKEISNVPHPDKNNASPIKIHTTFFIPSP
jgi:hypothetical protein